MHVLLTGEDKQTVYYNVDKIAFGESVEDFCSCESWSGTMKGMNMLCKKLNAFIGKSTNILC